MSIKKFSFIYGERDVYVVTYACIDDGDIILLFVVLVFHTGRFTVVCCYLLYKTYCAFDKTSLYNNITLLLLLYLSSSLFIIIIIICRVKKKRSFHFHGIFFIIYFHERTCEESVINQLDASDSVRNKFTKLINIYRG